jgi:hypothetical protein
LTFSSLLFTPVRTQMRDWSSLGLLSQLTTTNRANNLLGNNADRHHSPPIPSRVVQSKTIENWFLASKPLYREADFHFTGLSERSNAQIPEHCLTRAFLWNNSLPVRQPDML